MNARTLAIIAAATVALVIIATLVTLSGTGAGPELPDRIAPGLYERSSEIERIRVATAEGETVLERDRSNTEPDETEGEGDEQQTERWIIADPYHGYPADPARVGALLRTLAELEPAERRTANPENHDLLGVQTVGEGEPRPDGTARVTLTDAEGQTIADLILGERAQTGRYARRAGENQTWLTAGAASVPSGSRRYLPSPVVEIPSARIESIAIEPAAGEGVTIRRTTDPETDTPFTVTGLPDGAELNSDANDILSRIVSSLSFVTPRDVLPDATEATDEDYHAEFLGPIIALKVVTNYEEATDHIVAYGSNHTEVIVTDHLPTAQRFTREVDASVVLVNASSRFSDGGELGLGAEIGISTTKLHAYGPMGLEALTTQKFVVQGAGETRHDLDSLT